MTENQVEQQKTAELEVPTGWRKPLRATRVRSDKDALCVSDLLRQLAARVPHTPAITPPEEGGMVRLGSRDRASYVWFLPCPEGLTDSAGKAIELCNHGIGIDRAYGSYEVRAWKHGAPEVHDITLHTHVVRMGHLEMVARLIGLPLEEASKG